MIKSIPVVFNALALTILMGPTLVRGQQACRVASGNATVCSVVSSSFTNFWGTCKLSSPLSLVNESDLTKKVQKQDKKQIDGIPDAIATSLNSDPLSNPIQIPNTIGISRYLTQIFASTDPNSLEIDNYISDLVNQSAVSLQQVGLNGTVYQTTCQGALAAALDANAGYTLPTASISGALKASASASSKSAMVFASGRFDSPLNLLLADSNNALYANFLLLHWRLNQSNSTRNAYFLAHAHGATFAQVTASQLVTSTGVTADAAGTTFIASAKLSASLSDAINAAYQASSFNGVIDKPSANLFTQIPTLADLKKAISQFPLLQPSNDVRTNFASPGDRLHLTQPVQGVPADVCQNGKWTVQDAVNAGQTDWTVQSLRSAPSVVASIPVCTFDFDILQGPGGATNFVASPQLKGTIVGTYNSDSVILTLNTLKLSKNVFPALSTSSPSQSWVTSASNLTFDIPFDVQQAPTGQGYDKISVTGSYTAICSGNNRTIKLYPTLGQSISISKNNQSQPKISMYFDKSERLGTLDDAAGSDPLPNVCTLNSGSILFTDSSGGLANSPQPIQASLSLKINFPHIKAVLTNNQPVCTSGKCNVSVSVGGIIDKSLIVGKPLVLKDNGKSIGTAVVDTTLNATFTDIPLDKAVAHSLVSSVVADADLSAADSNAVVPNLP